MTSNSPSIETSDLNILLNEHFAGKIVRKDLTKLVKEGANVPVFVLEYLLGNYCASQDDAIVSDGLKTVKRILTENFVRPDEAEKIEAEKIKSYIREKGTYKVIDLTFPVKSKIQQCKPLEPLSGNALRENSVYRRRWSLKRAPSLSLEFQK